ncbi:MAG: ABC transporter permease [Acidobacteriota bacterium]|jgi:predicted permease
MDSLWQDLRFGLRMLRNSPIFTAVAVISLAVGIGANTTVFGFVDAALLRPLAVTDPYELVVLGWRSPAGTELPDISTWGWYLRDDNGDGLSSSYSLRAFQAMRERTNVLTATFAFADMGTVNANYEDDAELAGLQVVSDNYYPALGIEAQRGRLLVADDSRPDADAVAVLSNAYWQRRFGGDDAVIGATLRLNDVPFTVVGVTPPDFRGTLQAGDNPDITVPLIQQPRISTSSRDMSEARFWWLHVMGRVAPGVSLAAAQEQLNALFHQSVQADMFPDGIPEQYTLPDVDLRDGSQGMTEQRGLMQAPLRIMAAVVALVLLIACVNVASLLMARAGTRRREIAVRLSLGAGRRQVVRQLIAESVVLSLVAGALGVGLAVWGRELLVRALSTRDLYVEGVRTDWRVLGFGLLISLLTGLLFGLVPAFRSSRPDLAPALRDGAGGTGRRHGGLWGLRAMLVSQVAMSMLLLVVAGLFVRTLLNLEREATGFDADGVAIMRVDPGLNGYAGEREVSLYDELLRRLRAIPGVQAATVASHSPVSGHISYTTLKISGYEPSEDDEMGAVYNMVGPDFFDTFRIPLLLGRGISEQDREGAPKVAVVNQTFVERFFPDESPIGHRIGLGRDGAPDEYEIVGVAANVKYQQLSDRDHAVAHVALAQHAGSTPSPAMTLAVRTSGNAAEVIGAGRDVVRRVDADIPVFEARTLAEQQATTLEMQRLFARMSVMLGALALGLACIGLYAMLSYNVVRRTREIGVRMALGARRADVARLVMRELPVVLGGIAIGFVAAVAATRWMESLVYELSTTDPVTYAAAMAVLVAVATLAAYVPARRATGVDPVIALRAD